MTDMKPQFAPLAGQVEELEPGLRRILAPNPSPMTFWGTNTYLLGSREIAVIDPGPHSTPHLNSILTALLPGQRITHIFVTHSHIDHSPLASQLSGITQAEVYAFGSSYDGQSQTMRSLVKQGYSGGGEGVDSTFSPQRRITEGDLISGDDWQLGVLETPGHFSNHLSFSWKDALFTGDHIMDWASSMVSPPDGDLGDFMKSCHKLLSSNWRIFYPGHGNPVHEPKKRTEWLINHRMSREMQILDALRSGSENPYNLAKKIYTETPKNLLGAAAQNVFAHLIDLRERGIVECDQPFGFETLFKVKTQK